ncbi:MAG: aminopeptidase P N-terminal domain-containing protein [Roseburia sp.]|nr:aminopeptidase P N-terminal domain-containing protein [Roseburia sp.]MCM1098408.1 aminopeptidase P N-terminal domain-containing protein [Ruminococcus flavefaciens]
MDFQRRRDAVLEKMEPGSIAVLYSGIETHVSADEYAAFQANRNFFYLTGLRRERMALVLDKAAEPAEVTLFIEEADPDKERWYGRKVTEEEAREISGIEKISLIGALEGTINSKMTREDVTQVYFDTYRHSQEDLPDYNAVMAKRFRENYPGTPVRNLFPLVAAERMWKDEDEVSRIREAVGLTKNALERVMKALKPGMKEYQVQAEFEYDIFRNGADGPAFPTIAGSGRNGTMLHYDTNRETCEDGALLLLDLGARVAGYNADITRTYPVNGKFTERQKQVYDIVLAANRRIAAEAKPGMTLKELNEICKKVLAEGLIGLGLIEKEDQVSKYYMHSVSHHLGIDVHDVTVAANAKLRPGAVITDEPGLYIDEWEIGIRIEDDLLITENGAEVLSADIIRTTEEIEAFMAG